MSMAISGLFFLMFLVIPEIHVMALADYLFRVNLALAAFNLLPAYPLDGGRMLHSIFWARWQDLKRATRVSSVIGTAFGGALIAGGIAHSGDRLTGKHPLPDHGVDPVETGQYRMISPAVLDDQD